MISSYCLAIGIVSYSKPISLQSRYLVSDVFSVITALFQGYVGYLNKDVPQIENLDSVVGAFPNFRSKLESVGGIGSRIGKMFS